MAAHTAAATKAADQAAAGPVPSTIEGKKPAIWAVMTPTGRPTRPTYQAADRAKGKAADKAAASSVPNTAERKAAVSPTGQAADKAAATPWPSVIERKKPPIWAVMTSTGRPRNRPAPPPSPPKQQPQNSSSQGSTVQQGSAQSGMPAGVQSSAVSMTYIGRPAIDGAGKLTGRMEIVPASDVPAVTPGDKSVSSNVVAASEALSRAVGKPGAVANQPEAVPSKNEPALDRSGAERDTAQASSSSPGASSSSPGANQGADQPGAVSLTYVTRPAIDAVGRPTGRIEVVPASDVPAVTPHDKSVSSNVVAASEALRRAVGKPGAMADQPGAVPNRGEPALDRSSAERDTAQSSSSRAGASSISPGASQAAAAAAEDGRRSNMERSSSWKTG